MPDKNTNFKDFLEHEWGFKDFLKHEWGEKAAEICPMCEQPTTIEKIYAKRTYGVRDQQITVRQTMSRCPKCGESWVSTKDDEDGLEKAYAIYMKRKNPEARKFKMVSFERGGAYVSVCSTCTLEYSLRKRVCSRIKHAKTCDAKGCNNQATYLVKLGKI